jgi:hypothetical protein
MTIEDVVNGWHHAPASERWVCPECREVTSTAEWKSIVGSDAYSLRACPRCETIQDHVWGSRNIELATNARRAMIDAYKGK